MRSSVTVDDRRARKKLNKLQSKVLTASQETTRILAHNISMLAKQLAPRYSDKTANLIGVHQQPTPKGSIARVWAKNPTPHKTSPAVDGPFNLTRWMHETRGTFRSGPRKGIKHIKSGDPTFMWSAANIVRRDKKRILENTLRGK